MNRKEEMLSEIRASDSIFISYGDGDLGKPIKRIDAIKDIESMDEDSIGEGTWQDEDERMEKENGSVNFEGKRYILTTPADFTGRLLPSSYKNIHEVEDGEKYDFEMAAPACNKDGENCTIFWIFSDIKGENGTEDLSNFDYSVVDHVRMD